MSQAYSSEKAVASRKCSDLLHHRGRESKNTWNWDRKKCRQ